MDLRKLKVKPSTSRVSREAVGNASVDFDPTVPEPVATQNSLPPKVLDPAPVVDWRGSSYDLLNGLDIQDHSDSIPGELFDRLFRR